MLRVLLPLGSDHLVATSVPSDHRAGGGVAAQNTLMGDGSAPALGQHPSCPLQPPVWMRGYRVRAEAALIGPILPSGLYLSLLGSSFSPSTFAKPGSSFCALRSLQKKSSLNPRYCPLPLTAFSDHCPFLVSLSLSLSFTILPDPWSSSLRGCC